MPCWTELLTLFRALSNVWAILFPPEVTAWSTLFMPSVTALETPFMEFVAAVSAFLKLLVTAFATA